MSKEQNLEVLIEIAKQTGATNERVRILQEIEKSNLPVGTWNLIKYIICPPK